MTDICYDSSVEHLYVSPSELCNLKCKICYTRKHKSVLTRNEIEAFILSYEAILKRHNKSLKSVMFCGGEVFLLDYFTDLVNRLVDRGIFVRIVTNGTIDKLSEIQVPNSVDIIVSLDGIKTFHDQNRGPGMWDKSAFFLSKAVKLGFQTEIFSVVWKENLSGIDAFEREIQTMFNNIPITYHIRKPLKYLQRHKAPITSYDGNGFRFLDLQEVVKLMQTRTTFPSAKFGCYNISLMSDRKIYSCCEGIKPLGTIQDELNKILGNYIKRVEIASNCGRCLGCTEPEFWCGFEANKIIEIINET